MMPKPVRRPVVRSFVIRIYRSSPDTPDLLLGEAEEVGEKGLRSFKNLEELWAIVNRRGRKPGPGGKKEMPGESHPSGTNKRSKHHEI